MINIQRNFFIENILSEAKINDKFDISKIPYKDNIVNFTNDKPSLILLDIDRIKNINYLKKDVILIKNNNSNTIFIPVSQYPKKIYNLIKYLEKFNLNNLILVNIYKLGLNKISDNKREKIFKTYLTVDAQLTLSKLISNMITLLINKDIRLVSLDLDETCWTGVIGEDGLSKIFLDKYQKKSLNYINKLINKIGLIVSIHSKNNEKIAINGIKKKLSKYPNFIKKTFKYINWNAKNKSIKKITKLVNFSKNNIIYFDDNISEIKQINKFLLSKNCFWIKNSYFFYLYSKCVYISNYTRPKNKKRFKDIKSNIVRSEISESKGVLNYIKTSKLKVKFTVKKLDLKRCEEMSNKINQFNSNYKRYDLKKIKSLNNTKNIKIVTFSVSDKYSDSGIISNIILEKNKMHDLINEFTISCRALGRGLEYHFLNQLIKKFSIKELRINYIKTDRNEPFINFAEKISSKKNKKMYWINITKVKKISENYEKYIKTKIN